jgi:hypothetical protein
MTADRPRERLKRRICAEVGDSPAVLTEEQSEDDEREVVLLAFDARQESKRPGAAPPTARERHQAAADHVAREVLLNDRYVAVLPPVAELVQVRHDDLAENCVDTERAEQAVEEGLGSALVE